MIYLWLKAGHILFVIFWMAGLFMLPRFFIYHQECEAGSAEDAQWKEREARLRKIILTPSLIMVWLFGISLAIAGAWWSAPWLLGKLLIVILLTGYHGWLTSYAKALAHGERRLEGRKLRLLNEVPGLAAAVIVVLAVLKPF